MHVHVLICQNQLACFFINPLFREAITNTLTFDIVVCRSILEVLEWTYDIFEHKW
jgi:hypothetical protein